MADAHFAADGAAPAMYLLREGHVARSRSHVTGNTVVDAVLDVAARPRPAEAAQDASGHRQGASTCW